jgi:glycosyltransferase involved in cell wall biosynthesis
MPTYEPNPAHLRAAIECVLNQTEKSWELFIHDDASTADTRAMVEPFLHDKRITFVKSSERLGIGGNWNACLTLGRAANVQYLFQDDLWTAQYLETALKILDTFPDAGFVSVEHAYLCEAGMDASFYKAIRAFKREHVQPGIHSGRAFLQLWLEWGLSPNIIGEPSFVMLRRDVIERAGRFSETLPQCLDLDAWMRCLLTADWYNCTDELGSFRVHKGAATARNEESGAGIYDRLLCFETLIKLLPSGELKRTAVHARDTALLTMARKFLNRRKSGKKTPLKGGGGMKAFAMRHPILMIRCLLQALWQS